MAPQNFIYLYMYVYVSIYVCNIFLSVFSRFKINTPIIKEKRKISKGNVRNLFKECCTGNLQNQDSEFYKTQTALNSHLDV